MTAIKPHRTHRAHPVAAGIPNACAQHNNVGGARVSFEDGHLNVKGTKKGDDIKLERVNTNTIRLTLNSQSKDDNVRSADIKGGTGADEIDAASDPGLESLHIVGGKGKDKIRSVAMPAEDSFDRDGTPTPLTTRANQRTTIRGDWGDEDIVTDANCGDLLPPPRRHHRGHRRRSHRPRWLRPRHRQRRAGSGRRAGRCPFVKRMGAPGCA